jgi:hypothetical protein
MTAAHLAGVLVVSAALASLVLAGGLSTRAEAPAIGAALLTGVTITAYTTIDGLGVRHSGTPVGYAAWLFLAHGPVLPLIAVYTRPEKLWSQARPHLVPGLGGRGAVDAGWCSGRRPAVPLRRSPRCARPA